MWKSTLLILCFGFFSCFFLGCEGQKGPTGPQGEAPILVSARLGQYYPYYSGMTVPEAEVLIENIFTIPSVEINDIQLEFIPGWGYGEVYLGAGTLLFRYEDFPISAGDSAQLYISFLKDNGETGIISGEIVMPGEFGITSPDTAVPYEPNVGEDFSMDWSVSTNASAYMINFYLYYYYYDTSGNDIHINIDIDTVITENTITFSSNQLFDGISDTTEIVSGFGSASVIAFAGPYQEGEPANIVGDGSGYFYGYTSGDKIDFEIGNINP